MLLYHERMRSARCAVLGLCLFLAFGCHSSNSAHSTLNLSPGPVQEWAAKQPKPTEGDDLAGKEIALLSNALAFRFFKAVDTPGQNIVISPLSMTFGLAMLADGAKSKTQKQILDALGDKGGLDVLNQGVRDLMIRLHSGKDCPVSIANGVWTFQGLPFDPKFQKTLQSTFDASVGSGNADTANKWISDATRGMITNCVDPLGGEEKFAMANTAAFAGAWKVQFDPKKTRTAPFALPNMTQVAVPMMRLEKQEFYFSYDEKLTVAMLPYRDEDFAIVLLQPEHGTNKSPEDLLAAQTWESWGTLLGGLYKSEIDVELPKWSFATKLDTKNALSKLGLSQLMLDGDFSAIGPKVGGAFLSQAKHAATIQVDEQGTQAAAVSVNIGAAGGEGFSGIRPFAFAIIHRPTGAILFLGVVNDPTKQ